MGTGGPRRLVGGARTPHGRAAPDRWRVLPPRPRPAAAPGPHPVVRPAPLGRSEAASAAVRTPVLRTRSSRRRTLRDRVTHLTRKGRPIGRGSARKPPGRRCGSYRSTHATELRRRASRSPKDPHAASRLDPGGRRRHDPGDAAADAGCAGPRGTRRLHRRRPADLADQRHRLGGRGVPGPGLRRRHLHRRPAPGRGRGHRRAAPHQPRRPRRRHRCTRPSCAPAFTLSSDPHARDRARRSTSRPTAARCTSAATSPPSTAWPQQHLAAIDIATCTVVNGLHARSPTAPSARSTSTADTVYFGGALHHRQRPGPQPGRGGRRPSAPPAPARCSRGRRTFDSDVRALALKPDGTAVVVGGDFDTVNGAGSHALAVRRPRRRARDRHVPGRLHPADLRRQGPRGRRHRLLHRQRGHRRRGVRRPHRARLGDLRPALARHLPRRHPGRRGLPGRALQRLARARLHAPWASTPTARATTCSPSPSTTRRCCRWFPDTNDGIGEQHRPARPAWSPTGRRATSCGSSASSRPSTASPSRAMTRFGQTDQRGPRHRRGERVERRAPAQVRVALAPEPRHRRRDADLPRLPRRSATTPARTPSTGTSLLLDRAAAVARRHRLAARSTPQLPRHGQRRHQHDHARARRTVTVARRRPRRTPARVLADGASLAAGATTSPATSSCRHHGQRQQRRRCAAVRPTRSPRPRSRATRAAR